MTLEWVGTGGGATFHANSRFNGGFERALALFLGGKIWQCHRREEL